MNTHDESTPAWVPPADALRQTGVSPTVDPYYQDPYNPDPYSQM